MDRTIFLASVVADPARLADRWWSPATRGSSVWAGTTMASVSGLVAESSKMRVRVFVNVLLGK